MNTENLQTLKIHKLTQVQYDRELAAGNIDENALYLTPDEEIDLSPYATTEQVNAKADADHNHDDVYYTEIEIDTLLSGKAASSHNHAASNITSGTLSSDRLPTVPISKGGTGATTASAALTNLGITATATELNKLDGVTATAAELNYVDGVTSNIQTQLDGKASSSHTHNEYMTSTNSVGTGSFSMNRLSGSTVGDYSSTLGKNCTASGWYSHAEGLATTASAIYSHAEGCETEASGQSSHAEGQSTQAQNSYSHAEGDDTLASGYASHAEGGGSQAQGNCSHAEGNYAIAEGDYSHAEGFNTNALKCQHAQGHYNNTTSAKAGIDEGTSTGTAFVIGNGTRDAGSNAFRVTYDGKPYAKSNIATTGCDYAEFFEWQDLNPDSEDRRGYFVTLDEDKIKIAEPNDYILGIISGQPSIVGNGDEDWLGRYVFDEFGAFVYEDFDYQVEEFDKETGEKITVTKTSKKYKENPDYDPTIPYIQREDRPEWDAVGMLGVLSVRDDGTCKVNGYCTVAEGGIATASETGYRVIKRVNNNIVRVIFR